jgi:hypothetical protein
VAASSRLEGNDERDGQAVARLVTGRTACQAINAGGDTQHTSYATRAQTHAFMEQWEQSLDDARKAVTVKRDYVKVSPPSVRVVVRAKTPSASS